MCTSNIVGAKVVCGQCFRKEVVIPPSPPLSQSNPSGSGTWMGQATVPPGPGTSLQKREGLSRGRPSVGLHSSQVTTGLKRLCGALRPFSSLPEIHLSALPTASPAPFLSSASTTQVPRVDCVTYCNMFASRCDGIATVIGQSVPGGSQSRANSSLD